MRVLLTGAAGFIGFHLARHLLDVGLEVSGVDSLTGYYATGLKQDRLKLLQTHRNFSFSGIDLCHRSDVEALFAASNFDLVLHLAAQPGVRYSVDAPHKYVESNLLAFMNVLEACRQHRVKRFVFASSSSVYGNSQDGPFAESADTDHPESLYAATKKANEVMAHSYSRQFGLQVIGLRFFSVYGPWGRPDMAYFSFTRKILAGESIPVFNQGQMVRDFTYIGDICQGISQLIKRLPDLPSYQIYNLGNNHPVMLMDFIASLETALSCRAQIDFQPMQTGDVTFTNADISLAQKDFNYAPKTSLQDGLSHFVDWYHSYYK